MKIPKRLRPAAWLTTVVLAIALISAALAQPYYVILVVAGLAGALLAIDWLMGAPNSD